MSKGKIIKFNKSMEYYFDLAGKFAEEGKFSSALEIFRKIKTELKPQSGDWVGVSLEIALCYMDLGLFELALNEYFKVMRYGLDLDEIFYSIAKCCTFMNLSQQAALYLNLGVDLGLLLPEDGFAKIDLKNDSKLKLVKKLGQDYMVEIARQLIKAKDENYAVQILESVDKSSPQFVEACNYMGIISLANNEPHSAIARLKEAYAVNPENIMTLTELIIAYSMIDKPKELELVKEELLRCEISDQDDLFKVVVCFAQIQDDKLASYFVEKLLVFQPYDLTLNCILAACQYNLGDSIKAKRTIVALLRIYGSNFILLHYGKLIDSAPRRLQLATALAPEEQSEIMTEFSSWIDGMKDELAATDEILNDSYRFNQFLWFLKEGAVTFATVLINELKFKGDEWKRIFRELLVATDIPTAVKKVLLDKYLVFSKGGDFELVASYVFQVFSPKIPNVSKNEKFILAYYKVFAASAFLESGFDKKINHAYTKLVKEYINVVNAFSVNRLAAVLAFEAGISPVFAKLKDCCEVFDCNYDELTETLSDMSSLIGNDDFFKKLKKSEKEPAIKNDKG